MSKYEEDPGKCIHCGKKMQLIRPGKSQPNCDCYNQQEEPSAPSLPVDANVRRTMWAVFSGANYTEGGFDCVFDKKKDAISAIRADGYKYNKEQGLYINNDINTWYRIEKCGVNDLYA